MGARRERRQVKIPMMPKGVEHNHPILFQSLYALVKIPMMPKGVEHVRREQEDLVDRREDSNDAERR